jgi:hypothetical protein
MLGYYLFLIPCFSFASILIYNNLHSICHEKIYLKENGERDMPTIVHFQIPADDIERSKSK